MHRVAHRGVDGVCRVGERPAFVEAVGGAPIAAFLDGSVCAHVHAVGGGELEDALEERLRQRGELEHEVLLERLLVKLAAVGGVFENAFDLGGEDDLRPARALHDRVIERLDEEAERTGVGYSEREY